MTSVARGIFRSRILWVGRIVYAICITMYDIVVNYKLLPMFISCSAIGPLNGIAPCMKVAINVFHSIDKTGRAVICNASRCTVMRNATSIDLATSTTATIGQMYTTPKFTLQVTRLM
jgi:hypothetical protein